jgi:hypothetical protein
MFADGLCGRRAFAQVAHSDTIGCRLRNAAWTGSARWVRVAPQGRPGATVSGKVGVESWGDVMGDALRDRLDPRRRSE